MAIFFSLGLAIGGVGAPYIFGLLIREHSRDYISLGYQICNKLFLIQLF